MSGSILSSERRYLLVVEPRQRERPWRQVGEEAWRWHVHTREQVQALERDAQKERRAPHAKRRETSNKADKRVKYEE